MLCLLQSSPIASSALKQTHMSVDTSFVKNVRDQSVSGRDINVSVNSRSLSTKGISSAVVTATDETHLKGNFHSGTVFKLKMVRFWTYAELYQRIRVRKDFVEFCKKCE